MFYFIHCSCIDPMPAPPTCSCGPPGTDLEQQEIPFGTIWHVDRCDVW